MTQLRLSTALLPNDHVRPLLDQAVQPEGITLDLTKGLVAGDLFWRQLHDKEFDLAEMSVSDLVMMTAHGDTSFLMLPVFMTRRFFHTNIVVREAAGITTPSDLAGRRVGVQEYVQTANLWTRGVLQDEFGLDFRTIHWHQERLKSHSHSHHFGIDQPAPQFTYLAPEATLGEMMLAGELDAVMTYSGRRTRLDRSTVDLRNTPGFRPLFAKAKAEGARFFTKTGLFPMNHAPVIRRSIVEAHPWVVHSLCAAFEASKRMARAQMLSQVQVHADLGLIPAETVTALTRDLFPFGLSENRAALETALRYSYEQGLSPRPVALSEIIADPDATGGPEERL